MNQNTDQKLEAKVERDEVVDVDAVEATTLPTEEKATDKTTADTENIATEEFRIQGDELVTKVKTLIHAGNIRRIIIKNEIGHPLIEIPLTIGVVGGVLGAALFPVLAAVGAIGAVATHLTLVIEKRE